MKLVGACGP